MSKVSRCKGVVTKPFRCISGIRLRLRLGWFVMAQVSQRRREVGGHEAGVTRRQGPTEPGGSFGSQDK